MTCSIGCAKCLIIVFNIVYAILGIALTSIGVIFRSQDAEYDESTNEVIANVDQARALMLISSLLFLVSGVVIILFAAYGCCASIKEHTCLLKLYAVILIIFCIVQIAISAFAFVTSSNLDAGSYKDVMQKSFNDYANNTSVQNAFEHFQKKYSCCGVDSYHDYNEIQTNLPSSCCINTKTSCYLYDTVNLQPTGCSQKQLEKVIFTLKTVGAISTVVAVLEVIGAILAYYLANTIRNEKRRGTCT